MELKLNEDQVDSIVTKELKSLLNFYVQEKDTDMIGHVLAVLGVYLLPSDFETILKYHNLKKPEESNKIVIDEIIDNEDGSSLMNFTVSDSIKNSLISEGFKYLLIKYVLGNPTDDEIITTMTNAKEVPNV